MLETQHRSRCRRDAANEPSEDNNEGPAEAFTDSSLGVADIDAGLFDGRSHLVLSLQLLAVNASRTVAARPFLLFASQREPRGGRTLHLCLLDGRQRRRAWFAA